MQRIVSICVLVASGALRISTLAGPGQDVYEGRITAASKAAISIVDKQGENLTLLIGADCRITRDGKPSEAMMLGVGDRVRVAARDESGKIVAASIDAFSLQHPVSLAASEPVGP